MQLGNFILDCIEIREFLFFQGHYTSFFLDFIHIFLPSGIVFSSI